MINIVKQDGALILEYDSDQGDNAWLYEKLKNTSYTIKGTFHVDNLALYGKSAAPNPDSQDPVEFKIASIQGEYYVLNKEILQIGFDLLIHKGAELTPKWFVAERKVSIFSRINELEIERMVVGGTADGNMPEAEYLRLIETFPTSTELRKYVLARVGAVVRDFFETARDAESQFRRYVNDRFEVPFANDNLTNLFREDDLRKYSLLKAKLSEMLTNENAYSEAKWQNEILQIILLLYPKYIRAIKEASIKDAFEDKWRKADILLVDSSGNVDILEIKQPFDKCIVTTNQYRDNHIPLRELSGTVMQIEKYLLYLNKWGADGETILTNKYNNQLPSNFRIKITNPTGFIIMGRDNNLNERQRKDFEIIKRKYKSIVDIITYDDLLRRLTFTIQQLTSEQYSREAQTS